MATAQTTVDVILEAIAGGIHLFRIRNEQPIVPAHRGIGEDLAEFLPEPSGIDIAGDLPCRGGHC